eukprot:753544-Hanusia_phi.AAC.3
MNKERDARSEERRGGESGGGDEEEVESKIETRRSLPELAMATVAVARKVTRGIERNTDDGARSRL